jgi:glucose-6-phosphate isomerase
MRELIELPVWKTLVTHQQEIADQHMRDWFAEDPQRFSRYSLQVDEILFDYSRNRITDKTMTLLHELALTAELRKKITALFAGEPVNKTEKRAALHTALRDKRQTRIDVNGTNIATLIAAAREKMQRMVGAVHSYQWRGVTGKPITHLVSMGVGGSYLGPMMCTHALKAFAVSTLPCYFISGIDDGYMMEVLAKINPETTLFIIASKSFTTLETMANARTMGTWLTDKLGADVLAKQFIAVTAALDRAREFGIPDEHILPLWDWVGGRYSIWSSMGLPLALCIGNQRFTEFLDGAYAMDQHFLQAPFTANIPVLLALLSIWYVNFFDSHAQAIVPYTKQLRYLTPYLQQTEMESNGKSVDLNGDSINYLTGSVVFGEEGTNGQHAYHQLLHQSQRLIPVDFILVGKHAQPSLDASQDILVASGLSQAAALMCGKTYTAVQAELLAAHFSLSEANYLAPHKVIPGNKPSNILFLDQLTPKNLGALLALYEHKVFAQGAIWNINSFDQWGVELGKQLLPDILALLQGVPFSQSLDAATMGLIAHFKKIKAR